MADDKIATDILDSGDVWTEILKPKENLFQLHLKEVWHYRDLIFLFVKRDIASQYRQTILGPLWFVIQPAITTIMFLIVFNRIAGIKTGALPATLFYMSSITIWTYFSTCLTATSNTFVANAGIFGKVYFPRLVLPLSSIISNLVKLAIQFGLLVALLIYDVITRQYFFQFGWHILLFPLIVIFMGLMGLGLGIIISSLTTKYRDLSILITFGVGLLMYVTPVAYPLAYLQQSRYRAFIEWNPLTPLIEGFRYSLFGTGTYSTGFFVYSLICTLLFLLVGILIFNKVEKTFMDTV